MRAYRFVFFLVLSCGFLLMSAFSAGNDDSQESSLVLIGGGLGDGEIADRVHEKMVELSGGTEGKIGVITSSRTPYEWDCEENGESENGGCNDPDANNSKMGAIAQIEEFESYGIDAEWIPVDQANTEVANDESLANEIDQGEYSGFFLDGGNQWRHIESFFQEDDPGERIDSLVMNAIQNQFEQGNLMIGGNSAGAAVQATDIMVVGGNSSHNALVNGSAEGRFPDDSSQLAYYEDGGFGFFDYGIPEQHFAERGREGRAIRLAADTNQDMVYGIDETTALIVTDTNTPQAEMEVMGDNGVQIFNFEQANVQDAGVPGNWAIENISSTYLTDGDRYLPDSNTAMVASNKENIDQNELDNSAQEPSHDIFGDREFIDTATQLFNASDDQKTTGYTQEIENLYQFDFEQTSESKGFYVDNSDGRTISYQDLKIDVQPLYLTSASEIKTFVERFEEDDEFEDDEAPNALKRHLTAVGHYEDQEEAEKVIRHMEEGFKDLLNHQRDNELISEEAYHTLITQVNNVVESW